MPFLKSNGRPERNGQAGANTKELFTTFADQDFIVLAISDEPGDKVSPFIAEKTIGVDRAARSPIRAIRGIPCREQ